MEIGSLVKRTPRAPLSLTAKINPWWFWLGAAGRFVPGDAVRQRPRGKSSFRACLAACGKVRRVLAWGSVAGRAVRVAVLQRAPAARGTEGKDHV